MKGLLLRVGIDKGSGGCHAPIYKNNSFEYIPVPENRATSETMLYANIRGITGKPFPDYILKKVGLSHPHYDPEFVTFTYGDPGKPKRDQLTTLDPGDLLIFYAGLKPNDGVDKSRLYVIGYFIVKEVYDFKGSKYSKKIPKADYPYIFNKLRNNAHAKIYFRLKELNSDLSEENLVIIQGDPNFSKLLKKALLISDNSSKMLKELEPIFGYKGSLQRAVGHWIKEENISKVEKWLKENGE